MGIRFDGGYRRPYASLVYSYPGEDVYPPDSFRTEWGPIFHRGRLDGSARLLVIGQDPAAHETVCRRVLVGEAGQRVQGMLAKLGITHSYVLVNTFVYSVYGQGGGSRHIGDVAIAAYRNRWLDTLAGDNQLEAIVTLGRLADQAYRMWKATPTGTASAAMYANVLHPTYPEAASASGTITEAAAFARLCASWNAALEALRGVVAPDEERPLVPYGARIESVDLAPIPAEDLPPGLPAWMRSLETWAARVGGDAQSKRATITIEVPPASRTWPVPT